MKRKDLSVGVIVTDFNNILLGHITMSKWWDIFKGLQDHPNEDHKETAIRELYEESGIIASKYDLEELGKFEYNSKKDLYLYLLKYENLNDSIKLDQLKCISYFYRKDRKLPEIDKYKIVSIDQIPYYCSNNMSLVLMNILINDAKGVI